MTHKVGQINIHHGIDEEQKNSCRFGSDRSIAIEGAFVLVLFLRLHRVVVLLLRVNNLMPFGTGRCIVVVVAVPSVSLTPPPRSQ